MGRIYGYIRVSSEDQNESRQLRRLDREGIKKSDIFSDKSSGKDFDRPRYKELINTLRKGDTLYIISIDRLGRNYAEIQEQWKYITGTIGADIVVTDMPLLDTRREKDLLGTFISDLVLQILSFVSQSERENIHKRQRQGIAAARSRGVHMGRPEKPLPDSFYSDLRLFCQKRLSSGKIAEKYKISQSTLYRRAKRYRDKKA